MSEKGQPLPYPLDDCARCREVTAKLEASRQCIRDREREHLEACAELDEVTAKLADLEQP